MMGDDMAIRSGGMYGNPESRYTIANPNSSGGALSGITPMARFMKMGFGIMGSFANYGAQTTQIANDLATLRREKAYNIKNFQQYIADTMARNKMSFYSSGLDIKSGTAQDVMISNRQALQEDLDMMEYNYNMKERSLKEEKKAARANLAMGIASSVINAF